MARNAPELERNLAKIRGWLAIVPQGYLVCEYLADTYQPALVDTTASRLRHYAKQGLRGIWATYGRPKSFTAVWEYLFARLMWNPAQDPSPIAEEFIAHYYGAAAKPVAAFFQLAHQRYAETLKSNPELERLYAKLEDEYEIEERHRALERKLDLISRTAETVLDLLQTQRSIRVEWYIVILIVIEILLTLYELFVH